MDTSKKTVEELTIPNEFNKIINDFISDIVTTFPEYSGLIKRWWTRTTVSADDETNPRAKAEISFVFRHCVKVLPERFFDILYKNTDIFSENSTINTEFLPGVVFKQLWACDISDNTRETIWKYLQLVLFSVIGSVRDSSQLGDTAKLFEAINEDELKEKLSETLENMQSMFDNFTNKEDSSNSDPNPNLDDQSNDTNPNAGVPNVEDIHKHIHKMMEGKLGKLAMELAEETASELDLDLDETKDAKDVFQKLFKNPGKLMNMVKNIGTKIETKIKSGEIKESELMSEGMDLLNQMKNMPGMGDMSKMFSQMGIPGLGKNTKVNMGAMEAQMKKSMKTAQMRERMKAKASQAQNAQPNVEPEKPAALSEEELIKIFSTGEKVERTPRGAKPVINSVIPDTNAKKKKTKK
jgi:hypothetical protein